MRSNTGIHIEITKLYELFAVVFDALIFVIPVAVLLWAVIGVCIDIVEIRNKKTYDLPYFRLGISIDRKMMIILICSLVLYVITQ